MKISQYPDTYYFAEFTDGTKFTLVLKSDFEEKYNKYMLEGNTPFKKERITHVFESQDANISIIHIQDLIKDRAFFHLEMIEEEYENSYTAKTN